MPPFVELKLGRDASQNKRMLVDLAHLSAIEEVDHKKTELILDSRSVLVHGSFDEVTAKINAS